MEPIFHTIETTSDEDEYKTKNVDDTAKAYYTPDKFRKNIKYKVHRPFY